MNQWFRDLYPLGLEIVSSSKHIDAHRRPVQTTVYAAPFSYWYDLVKPYGIVIFLSVIAAGYALYSYLRSGPQRRRDQVGLSKGIPVTSTSRDNRDTERQEREEGRGDPFGGDLRTHLAELDKKKEFQKKKAKEPKLMGLNLTDVCVNNLNRDDHVYYAEPYSPQGDKVEKEDPTKGQLMVRAPSDQADSKDRDPGSKTQENASPSPESWDMTQDHAEQHHSFSTMSKRTTVTSHDPTSGKQSTVTTETKLESKSSFAATRRRAMSFRRLSVGDVMEDW